MGEGVCTFGTPLRRKRCFRRSWRNSPSSEALLSMELELTQLGLPFTGSAAFGGVGETPLHRKRCFRWSWGLPGNVHAPILTSVPGPSVSVPGSAPRCMHSGEGTHTVWDSPSSEALLSAELEELPFTGSAAFGGVGAYPAGTPLRRKRCFRRGWRNSPSSEALPRVELELAR